MKEFVSYISLGISEPFKLMGLVQCESRTERVWLHFGVGRVLFRQESAARLYLTGKNDVDPRVFVSYPVSFLHDAGEIAHVVLLFQRIGIFPQCCIVILDTVYHLTKKQHKNSHLHKTETFCTSCDVVLVVVVCIVLYCSVLLEDGVLNNLCNK